MVDYVAVLRRTIDALPKNTPEIRERVYVKARTTVEAKLAMINPPPSQALIAKQMKGLEIAIATVENDFAVALEPEILPEPAAPEIDPFADILGAMPAPKSATMIAQDQGRDAISNADAFSWQPELRNPVKSELPPLPSAPVARGEQRVEQPFFEPETAPERPRLPETTTLEFPDFASANAVSERTTDSFDDVFGAMPAPEAALPNGRQTNVQAPPRFTASRPRETLPPMPSLDEPLMPPVFARPTRQKASAKRFIVPVLGLAVLAGGAAFAWSEREQIIALLKPEQAPIAGTPTNTDVPVNPAVAPDLPAETAAQTTSETPAETAAETPAEPSINAPQKFTQRLNADGTEVDAGTGVAGGVQSMAQLEPAAQAPAAELPATETPATETPLTETPAVVAPVTEVPVTPAEPIAPAEALPVGQKAIFYEERTSGADGSARSGAVVWSVVRESPGNDRPPEPAIRGELTIPEAGLNVRMTLRRNADTTLPASHILELIMTVPDDFAGGTIEDVQRVNLKPSEESAGAPLAATPVKVADKFFLVALENTPAAVQANLSLLRDQSWIDLPIVYRTGRRALFTMEKGLVGDQVFKQVLDAWVAAPLQ